MYDPGEDPTAGLPPDPTQTQAIASQWEAFLGRLGQAAQNPNVLAAGVGFGTSLMAPRSFGDNATSQIGRAIGSGAETINRREAMDIKQQEADSKQDLRGAQADAATARSQAAASGVNTAEARLALRESEMSQRRTLAEISASNRLGQMYYTAKAKHDKDRAVFTDMPPFPDFNTWRAQNPALAAVPINTTESGVTGTEIPPAPADPAQRVAGKQYLAKDGTTVTWNGKNWQR